MLRSPSRSVIVRQGSRLTLVLLLAAGAVPALAQNNTELRLNKVEAEVRAIQRKVFPGNSGDRYFSPEISAPTPTPSATPLPSTSALSDVLTRMDSLEAQVARLTGQVEQNTNRITQLEARLAFSGQGGTASPTSGSAPAPNLGASTGAAASPLAPSTTPTPASAAVPAQLASSKPVAPPSSRVQAVSAIVKPSTGDAAEDEYSYGYRLWEAKFYPEAQQQLKLYLEKYPRSPRASWGRNLLGRAYLEDGNALEAAKWFVQNYQNDKRGERAPDSLLYLAVSMKQLKDTKRACIALSEFGNTYAAEAAGRLKSLYDTTRNGLTCGA